jgi:hypothetical protein
VWDDRRGIVRGIEGETVGKGVMRRETLRSGLEAEREGRGRGRTGRGIGSRVTGGGT